MEETIKRPPLPDDLPEIVYNEFLQVNYLIWRPTVAFEPFLDAEEHVGWECYCSACEERFFLEKKKNKIKSINKCPRCGAEVKSVRYDQRLQMHAEVMYMQRGLGTNVFVYLLDARCNFDIENGRDIDLNVLRIWNFDHSAAQEWSYRWEWDRDVPHGKWQMLRRCTEPKAAGYGLLPIAHETLKGSCLQYAQLETIGEYLDITQVGFDGSTGGLINYLRTYIRAPRVTEMLIKGGYINLVLEKIGCVNGDVNRLINWRAKDPKRVFRGGLTKTELHALAGKSSVYILTYRDNRKHGVQLAETSLIHALLHTTATPDSLHTRYGLDRKRVLKYLRRLHGGGMHLNDYTDYLRQLATLGNPLTADETVFPADFMEAHARASTRERLLKEKENNSITKWQYRYRRRELAKYAFRYKGMFVRAIDSAAEIIGEGEQQSNCVAGYGNRHMNGTTAIFVLRRIDEPRKSWYTVQLNPETLKVIQCRGWHNRERSAEEEKEKDEFMQRWTAFLMALSENKRSA